MGVRPIGDLRPLRRRGGAASMLSLVSLRPGDRDGRTVEERLRSLLVQVLIVVSILAAAVFLFETTLANLRARGIATGFDFLFRPVNMPIAHSWLSFVPGVSTYGRAIVIGFINTLWVSFIVIAVSTVIGTIVGICRLSPNWLLSRTCGAYVEAVRNVPVLLQLVFWYQLLLQLPPPREALRVAEGLYISNRGIRYPTFEPQAGLLIALAVLAAGFIFYLLARRGEGAARKLLARWALPASALAAAAAIVLLGGVGTWSVPEFKGFNFRGGSSLTPELSALVIGLTFYSSAFVAEIVRAGIQGVPDGQWEAAESLGLRKAATLRKVVLPQALRIIVPPLASEYLGIIKNSSLAVAVGYPDLVAVVNTMISDTGQGVEGVAIIMLAFLAISVSVSMLMNWYNARVALITR